MPILLDSSIGVGQLGNDLTHVMITNFGCDLLGKAMKLTVVYGYLDGGSNFISSNTKQPEHHIIENLPTVGEEGGMGYFVGHTKYDDEVSTHATNDGELTYNAVARGLYEWLIAEGHYVGAIV